MQTLPKYLRWIGWHLVYWFNPRPHDLADWILMVERLRTPWWKFRPHLFHLDENQRWEIWFEQADTYTRTMSLTLDVMVAQDDHRIVGLLIRDHQLGAPP